jgi:hypothetical protein
MAKSGQDAAMWQDALQNTLQDFFGQGTAKAPKYRGMLAPFGALCGTCTIDLDLETTGSTDILSNELTTTRRI